MFLDDTACNLASLNLMTFYDEETGEFDVDAFATPSGCGPSCWRSACSWRSSPRGDRPRAIDFRTLGLGYANLGTLLMVMGIPYDSAEGRAIAGRSAAILSGEAYATSAPRWPPSSGPSPATRRNREDMLRVIRNHRRAAYGAPPDGVRGAL